MINSTLSSKVTSRYPEIQFSVHHIGIDSEVLPVYVERCCADFAETVKQQANDITQTIEVFESFFRSQGCTYPLTKQFRTITTKGLPNVPPLIKALLYLEMTTGVLMGVQDSSAVQGELVLDLAQQGESFVGMRDTIVCQEGEIVVRDNAGIVASLVQGPDRKTQVTPDTTTAIFYVFSVPGLDESVFNRTVARVTSVLEQRK